MKTISAITAVILAVILFTACRNPTDPPAPTITDITLNTDLVKKAYYQNDQLDLSGLIVTAVYSNGSSATVTGYTSNPVNGATLSTPGTIPITITYTGGAVLRAASFSVTVTSEGGNISYTAEQTGGVDGTTTSTGIKFTFGASVDSLGLTVADIAVIGAASIGSAALSGTETTRTLSPITVNSAGVATVVITKPGIGAGTRYVTVYKAGQTAPTLTGITAVYTSTDTIYTTTPLTNLKNGLTVRAQYSNGSETTLSESEYSLSGTLTVGTSAVTVTYGGKTTTFTVTVILISPTISVYSPLPNSFLQGTVQFTGSATASSGEVHVEVKIFDYQSQSPLLDWTDTGVTMSGSTHEKTWTFSLDTQDLDDGLLRIQFRVKDENGFINESNVLEYIVKNQPPKIIITQPIIMDGSVNPPRMETGRNLRGDIIDNRGIKPGYPRIKFWPEDQFPNSEPADDDPNWGWAVMFLSGYDDMENSYYANRGYGQRIFTAQFEFKLAEYIIETATRHVQYQRSSGDFVPLAIGTYRFRIMVSDIFVDDEGFPREPIAANGEAEIVGYYPAMYDAYAVTLLDDRPPLP